MQRRALSTSSPLSFIILLKEWQYCSFSLYKMVYIKGMYTLKLRAALLLCGKANNLFLGRFFFWRERRVH